MNVKINLIEKHVIQIDGAITINVDVDKIICEKDYIWNHPATCNCENGFDEDIIMDRDIYSVNILLDKAKYMKTFQFMK